jgi:hypothetical protein
MKTSDKTDQISDALCKAQAAIDPPAKTKTAKVRMRDGGEYSYKYCDLSDVLIAVRRPLADHGLSITQGISGENGHTALHTRLMHSGGQWIESDYPVTFNGTPQACGSELTYARRYALCAMLGIAAEDDDDGNAATRQPKPNQRQQPTPAPQQRQQPRPAAKREHTDEPAQQPDDAEAQAADDERFMDEVVAAYAARGLTQYQASLAQRQMMKEKEVENILAMGPTWRKGYLAAIASGAFDRFKDEPEQPTQPAAPARTKAGKAA